MSEATAVPGGSTPPQNLLAQMEQLLAALDADLGQLDAEFQPPRADTGEADTGETDAGETDGRKQPEE